MAISDEDFQRHYKAFQATINRVALIIGEVAPQGSDEEVRRIYSMALRIIEFIHMMDAIDKDPELLYVLTKR